MLDDSDISPWLVMLALTGLWAARELWKAPAQKREKEKSRLNSEQIWLVTRLRAAQTPPTEKEWPILNGIEVVFADHPQVKEAWKVYCEAALNSSLNSDAGAAVREARKEKLLAAMKNAIEPYMQELHHKVEEYAKNDPKLKALLDSAESQSHRGKEPSLPR